MSSPLITINADSSPTDAEDVMLKNKLGHLLVVMTEPSPDKDKNESADDKYVLKPVGIMTSLGSKPLLPWNKIWMLVMLTMTKSMLSRIF